MFSSPGHPPSQYLFYEGAPQDGDKDEAPERIGKDISPVSPHEPVASLHGEVEEQELQCTEKRVIENGDIGEQGEEQPR